MGMVKLGKAMIDIWKMIKRDNERIGKHLAESGSFSDKVPPVIGASGQLLVFYLNTEKLSLDGGEFKKYGADSSAMALHAQNMAIQHPYFQDVIEVLLSRIKPIVYRKLRKHRSVAISGGQTRDWIFSCPVAMQLGLPHASLYKPSEENPDRIELLDRDGQVKEGEVHAFPGTYIIHIVDLITEAASCYDGKEGGWIPRLRKKGAEIDNLFAVVDRDQRGDEGLTGPERLAKIGVSVDSCVKIGPEFLQANSLQPEVALAYIKDPNAWAKKYLQENGALAFISFFDPKGDVVKAQRFMGRYRGTLQEAGKLQEFEQKLQDTYGKPLDQILGGN